MFRRASAFLHLFSHALYHTLMSSSSRNTGVKFPPPSVQKTTSFMLLSSIASDDLAFTSSIVTQASIVKSATSAVQHELVALVVETPGRAKCVLFCERIPDKKIPPDPDSTLPATVSCFDGAKDTVQTMINSGASSLDSLTVHKAEDKVTIVPSNLTHLAEESVENFVDGPKLAPGDRILETMTWSDPKTSPRLADVAILLRAITEQSGTYWIGPTGRMCYYYSGALYEALARIWPCREKKGFYSLRRGTLTLFRIIQLTTFASPVPANKYDKSGDANALVLSAMMEKEVTSIVRIYHDLKMSDDTISSAARHEEALQTITELREANLELREDKMRLEVQLSGMSPS